MHTLSRKKECRKAGQKKKYNDKGNLGVSKVGRSLLGRGGGSALREDENIESNRIRLKG